MSRPYTWNGTLWVPVPEPLAVSSSGILVDSDIATTTTLTLSPTSGHPGDEITLTAVVTAASGTPTGSVTFERLPPGGAWTVLGTDSASPWTAKYTLPSTLGTYKFRAKYAKNGSWSASTSAEKSLSNTAAATNKTWSGYASTSRSYKGDTTLRDDYYDSRCYHGYYSSTQGDQRSAVWFSVPSEVNGSNVTAVKIRLTRIGSLGDSSVLIACGYHKDTNPPSDWDNIDGRSSYNADTFTGDAWSSADNTTTYTLSSAIHAGFEAGAKGLTFGPSTGSADYCAFHGVVGVSSSEKPYLTIEYTV